MPSIPIKKRTYSDKLQDVRWQKIKTTIQIRDQFTCQKCGTKEGGPFDVHHRHYISGREPWDYPEQLMVLLCRNCHAEEEQTAEIVKELTPALHYWGYFNTDIRDEVNRLINLKMASIKTKDGNI